jgi:hypothetical protein
MCCTVQYSFTIFYAENTISVDVKLKTSNNVVVAVFTINFRNNGEQQEQDWPDEAHTRGNGLPKKEHSF